MQLTCVDGIRDFDLSNGNGDNRSCCTHGIALIVLGKGILNVHWFIQGKGSVSKGDLKVIAKRYVHYTVVLL